MSWTSPRTWVALEKPTAATMNTHIRDNFNAIGDPWTSWTPSFTASSGTPAVGNGTLAGGYIAAGKYINFWLQLVCGSTTTYGTGNFQFTLPVGESSHRWVFQGVARDASAGSSFPVTAERAAAAQLTVRCEAATAGNAFRSATSAIPFTWTTSDELFICGTYEAS